MKKNHLQWPKAEWTFFIVIYHSSLVKGAMNAARLCKLRNGVKKRLNFFYFQWEKVDQVRSEYLRSYLNWLHNWQLKSTRRSHTLKGSQSMGDGRILLKPRRDDSFKKVLWNEPNFCRIHLAGQCLSKSTITIYWPMILMCPSIIDFIGGNGLQGWVGGRGPWTLDRKSVV